MSEQDDYNAGREGRMHYDGQLSEAYQRGLAEREGRYQKNAWLAQRTGRSIPGAFLVLPAPMLVMLLIFAATIGIFAVTAFFPLGGGLTLLAYAIFYAVFSDPMVDSLVVIFTFLVPGFIVFLPAMAFEDKMARFALYRRIRYFWRLFGSTQIGLFIFLAFSGPDSGPSVISVTVIVLSVIAGHFVSKRLDKPYAGSNLKFSDARAARASIPGWKTTHFEATEEEMQSRGAAIRQAIGNLENSTYADAPKLAELRAALEENDAILEVKQRMAREVAALKQRQSLQNQ